MAGTFWGQGCLSGMGKILLCLLVVGVHVAKAQVVRGVVTDTAGNPLEGAVVAVYAGEPPVLVGKTRQAADSFSIKLDKAAFPLMIVTIFAGFGNDTVVLQEAGFLKVKLRPVMNELQSVVVRTIIPPATVRSDTIAFNASAYPVRPRAYLDELLRKLPGISVDADGNVTMQGQPVDKIYIDGKEFYLRDLRNATRNLPADIVAQVEVFDSQSDQAKLSGIRDHGQSKSINIKLKPKNKTGYFGNGYAGIGNDGNYAAGGHLSTLAPKQWLNADLSSNNLNNRFTGRENNGPPPAGEQVFTHASAEGRWQTSRLTTVLEANHDYTGTKQSTSDDRTTYLDDSTLRRRRQDDQRDRLSLNGLHTSVRYKTDTLSTIVYLGHIEHTAESHSATGTSVITAGYLLNTGSAVNTSDNHRLQQGHDLHWERKFHKTGRSLFAGVNWDQSWTREQGNVTNEVLQYAPGGALVSRETVRQQYEATGETQQLHTELRYTEPLSARLTGYLHYSADYGRGANRKKSIAFDSSTGGFTLPAPLTSNDFQRTNSSQDVSGGLFLHQGKLTGLLAIHTQWYTLHNTDLTKDTLLRQQLFNLFPFAVVNWQTGPGKNIQVSYAGDTKSPSLDQLQPVPDLSDPFLVKTGNPRLQRQFDHTVRVNYSAFNATTARNIQWNLDGTLSANAITASNTTLSGGVQQLQYINTGGVYHLNSGLTYGFPFISKKLGTATLSTNLGFHREAGYINGLESVGRRLELGGGAQLNLHLQETVFLETEARLAAGSGRYSLYAAGGSHTLSQLYRAELTYSLPGRLTLTSQYFLSAYAVRSQPPQQSSSWNMSLGRAFSKTGGLQARFSIFDLLNTAKSVQLMSGRNYIETATYNTTGRLFLLSILYDFRKFPNT